MPFGGFRTRQALADLDRATRTDSEGDPATLAFTAPADKALPAIARLLWQALSDHCPDPFLIDLWQQRQADIRAAPAPISAALMNGFDRLCDLQLLPEDCEPMAGDLITLPRESIEPALKTLARAMTLREIDHVSRADYGYRADRHREALVELLASPEIAYPPGEYWFPAEVVELVAHVPPRRVTYPAWPSSCLMLCAIAIKWKMRRSALENNGPFLMPCRSAPGMPSLPLSGISMKPGPVGQQTCPNLLPCPGSKTSVRRQRRASAGSDERTVSAPLGGGPRPWP
jgi:hypothetical protein